MKTFIFLYPEASFFEVNLVAYFMKTQGDVFIVAEDACPTIYTNEGITIHRDVCLSDVKVDDVDVFVICGGVIDNIRDKQLLYGIIQKCVDSKKVVGGICAGRSLVADAVGKLEYPKTTCVLDRIVLSPGNEYVDFALQVGKVADIYADDADYQETIDYFKYFKIV